MFDFTQYLGFLIFFTVLTTGFWLLFFLVGFVSYWAVGGVREFLKEKREQREEA